MVAKLVSQLTRFTDKQGLVGKKDVREWLTVFVLRLTWRRTEQKEPSCNCGQRVGRQMVMRHWSHHKFKFSRLAPELLNYIGSHGKGFEKAETRRMCDCSLVRFWRRSYNRDHLVERERRRAETQKGRKFVGRARAGKGSGVLRLKPKPHVRALGRGGSTWFKPLVVYTVDLGGSGLAFVPS